MRNEIIEKDPTVILGSKLRASEIFVKKFYLDDLDKYEVTRPSRRELDFDIDKNLVMYKITGLVFNKDENVLDRLNNVYSSMHGLNLSVIFMLMSDGEEVNFYLGTKTMDNDEDFQYNKALASAFETSFKGNFPGSEISPVDSRELSNAMNRILPQNGMNAITSLTCLPSLKDEDAENVQYVQGLEKFVDAMEGRNYTVLIISNPVTGGQIEQMKHGYEELYSEIAPMSEYSVTLTENEGKNISKSEMDGFSDTIGKSISKTQSFTNGTTTTKSQSTTDTFGISLGVMGSVGSMFSHTATSVENLFRSGKSKLTGGKVADASTNGSSSGIGGNFGINASRSKQTGFSTSESNSSQTGTQVSGQESYTSSKQYTSQEGVTIGSSSAVMVKYENKSIISFLECIDEHLKRLKQCENYGMWSSAAYFISPSKETSIIAANAFKGIINGEQSSLESYSFNTWFRDGETQKINEYLRHFTHPRFHDPDYLENLDAIANVTPSTILSTKELSVQCCLPFNSILGVYVRECAEFGRNVYKSSTYSDPIRIGSLYHMGETYEDHQVDLSVNSIRDHVFVTGSTGSGKSNTLYGIVSRLNGLKKKGQLSGPEIGRKIPTLIIEPAKGEYKQVFGQEFHVFGTNPEITELLKINPFKFEKQIHILEHIDRLVDIFNVCWPLYAAMPAVLKEAVELSYSKCGWDLSLSKNRYGYDIFPNFNDLLSSLRIVIKNSDYSQEVKDNYTGSLITRVKSLTNGLNGQIFASNETDNHKLFEESTIIDLSRVGSSETKSMIMGIIVMRLQERRLVQGGINLPLRHVTIIEEAHNLLKRTSYEQPLEGSNLVGKSVEMISNAIAEMRTYGEGFIIVDQAPGLLDMSAIRNTNTKIILHLPDMTDRELVGKSAGLNDNQLIELARIPTGVAAVYQNTWIEPVLCAIDHYKVNSREYHYDRPSGNFDNKQAFIKGKIAEYLISRLDRNEKHTDSENIKSYLTEVDIESSLTIDILNIITSKEKPQRAKVEYIISELVDKNNTAFTLARHSNSVEEWNSELLNNLEIIPEKLSQKTVFDILECLIHYRSLEYASDEINFHKWMEYMGRSNY